MTEALDFFNKHGFVAIGTGGGCEALVIGHASKIRISVF